MRQFGKKLRHPIDVKLQCLVSDPLHKFICIIFWKLIWYMTMNKIQVECRKGGYASIWTTVIAPNRFEKGKIHGFCSVA